MFVLGKYFYMTAFDCIPNKHFQCSIFYIYICIWSYRIGIKAHMSLHHSPILLIINLNDHTVCVQSGLWFLRRHSNFSPLNPFKVVIVKVVAIVVIFMVVAINVIVKVVAIVETVMVVAIVVIVMVVAKMWKFTFSTLPVKW